MAGDVMGMRRTSNRGPAAPAWLDVDSWAEAGILGNALVELCDRGLGAEECAADGRDFQPNVSTIHLQAPRASEVHAGPWTRIPWLPRTRQARRTPPAPP